MVTELNQAYKDYATALQQERTCDIDFIDSAIAKVVYCKTKNDDILKNMKGLGCYYE